ncbi:MAG: hypothetical protein AB7G93_01705 [Bdellovibrionales bacterium]
MDQFHGSSSNDKLKTPVQGGRSLSTRERQSIDHSAWIKGWGSDADLSARPGVPMDKAPVLGVESLYLEVEQQVPEFKIHKSTEHGRLTPVFGTSCPPTGLSGRIRDVAYRLSEGRLSHWFLLIFADRVNVLEDLLAEVATLRIPHIPREMGFAAELKYNKKGVLTGAIALGIGAFALIALARARQRRRQSDPSGYGYRASVAVRQ